MTGPNLPSMSVFSHCSQAVHVDGIRLNLVVERKHLISPSDISKVIARNNAYKRREVGYELRVPMSILHWKPVR